MLRIGRGLDDGAARGAGDFGWRRDGCTERITLENAAIRIEIDPAVFSVRFAGFPGGKKLSGTQPHRRSRPGGTSLIRAV